MITHMHMSAELSINFGSAQSSEIKAERQSKEILRDLIFIRRLSYVNILFL
jgi:hypothetical protein